MNMQRLLTLNVATILVFAFAASAIGQSKDEKPAKDQTNAEAPAQPAKKKKSFLEKMNEKLAKVNAALPKQPVSAQRAESTPSAPPAGAGTPPPAADRSVTPPTEPADTTTPDGTAAAVELTNQQPVNQTVPPVKPAKKKGFLDRLNDNLKKANEKLDKVNAAAGKPNESTPPAEAKPEAAPKKAGGAKTKPR